MVRHARRYRPCRFAACARIGLEDKIVQDILRRRFIERIIDVEIHNDRIAELGERTVADCGNAAGHDRVGRALRDQHWKHGQVVGIKHRITGKRGVGCCAATHERDNAARADDRFHLPAKGKRWLAERRESPLDRDGDGASRFTIGGHDRGRRVRVNRAGDGTRIAVEENLQATAEDRDVERAPVRWDLSKLNGLAADHAVERDHGREGCARERNRSPCAADRRHSPSKLGRWTATRGEDGAEDIRDLVGSAAIRTDRHRGGCRVDGAIEGSWITVEGEQEACPANGDFKKIAVLRHRCEIDRLLADDGLGHHRGDKGTQVEPNVEA